MIDCIRAAGLGVDWALRELFVGLLSGRFVCFCQPIRSPICTAEIMSTATKTDADNDKECRSLQSSALPAIRRVWACINPPIGSFAHWSFSMTFEIFEPVEGSLLESCFEEVSEFLHIAVI